MPETPLTKLHWRIIVPFFSCTMKDFIILRTAISIQVPLCFQVHDQSVLTQHKHRGCPVQWSGGTVAICGLGPQHSEVLQGALDAGSGVRSKVLERSCSTELNKKSS